VTGPWLRHRLGAAPKPQAFCKSCRAGASPSSAVGIARWNNTPPPAPSSPIEHRHTAGPRLAHQMPRTGHARNRAWRCRAMRRHCHWPGSGRAGLGVWLLIVGITASAAVLSSSGSLRLAITSKGASIPSWRKFPLPPGVATPSVGPPASAAWATSGHRGLAIRLDNRQSARSLGPAGLETRALRAMGRPRSYLHPGPFGGDEQSTVGGKGRGCSAPSKLEGTQSDLGRTFVIRP